MRDSAQHISSLRRHNVFHDMVTQIWPVQMQANHSGYHNGILLTFHVKQTTIASFLPHRYKFINILRCLLQTALLR
jgi:hypothetical protein